MPPPPLFDDLRSAGLVATGPLVDADRLSELPDEPGAYLLLIGLEQPLVLDIARFAGATLPAGWYVYAGNANGRGGLRARIARHLRTAKSIHWHIDHLTRLVAGAALCFSGADECDLVRNLSATATFAVPLPGFGSTDCRRCDSHLLRWTHPVQIKIPSSR